MKSSSSDSFGVQVIDLHMMDKRKYYPLALTSGFAVRMCLYPITLIRTRLQVQKQRTMYKGLFDAFLKIYKLEGLRGYYKGFWVSSLMIVPQLAYITVYENMREILSHRFKNRASKTFVSGGCASMASQCFVVPLDIVSQHLQMQGVSKTKPASVAASANSKNAHMMGSVVNNGKENKPRHVSAAAVRIVKKIYARDGLLGFYRGYSTSLFFYGTSSGLWWTFYDNYCRVFGEYAPDSVPRLALQTLAGPCAGVTACLLTNPLDIVRTRVQVQHTRFRETMWTLWKEEQMKIFTKGASARMTQSVIFSFCIILGYETIKRWSVLDEYKHKVRW